MREKNLAAIDLGTNSFHMIIVKVRPDGTTEAICREKETVRLGSGSGDYSSIEEDAMERGIQCLKRFKAIADNYKPEFRAIATSAIREADNRDIFIQRVKKEIGIKIEIVNGLEEARLIYLGILQGLPIYKKRILMIDIGGGSTEILVGERENVLFSQSLKLGAVRLTERYFKKEIIEPNDILNCRYHIETYLYPLQEEIERFKPELVVGSSGSVNSVGSIVLAMKGETRERLNGFEFTFEELLKVRELIDKAPNIKKRSKIPGLEEKRADIIVAGSLILEEVFRAFKIKKCIVSEYALREGIVYDTIRKWKRFQKKGFHRPDNIRMKSIQSILNLYPAGKEHSKHVTYLALRLFDELSELHGLGEEERELLEAAAYLHQVGMAISHSGYHKHSYYIIKNSEKMVGFNTNEIELIAQIARYHRKSSPKQKHEEFKNLSSEDQIIVKKLSAILKIADGLDKGLKKNIIDIRAIHSKNDVILQLKTRRNKQPSLEIYAVEENKQLFEEVYGKKLRLFY